MDDRSDMHKFLGKAPADDSSRRAPTKPVAPSGKKTAPKKPSPSVSAAFKGLFINAGKTVLSGVYSSYALAMSVKDYPKTAAISVLGMFASNVAGYYFSSTYRNTLDDALTIAQRLGHVVTLAANDRELNDALTRLQARFSHVSGPYEAGPIPVAPPQFPLLVQNTPPVEIETLLENITRDPDEYTLPPNLPPMPNMEDEDKKVEKPEEPGVVANLLKIFEPKATKELTAEQKAQQKKETYNQIVAHLLEREGKRLTAYYDSEGYPTVGIGTLITKQTKLEAGDTISKNRRDAFANADAEKAYKDAVKKDKTLKKSEYIKTFIADLKTKHGSDNLSVTKDSQGRLIVGYGHAVESSDILKVGDTVTEERCWRMFHEEAKQCYELACRQAVKYKIPEAAVEKFVIAMTSVNFQLGIHWESQWPTTCEHLKKGEYDKVCKILEESLWMKQTPKRVRDLIATVKEVKLVTLREPTKLDRMLADTETPKTNAMPLMQAFAKGPLKKPSLGTENDKSSILKPQVSQIYTKRLNYGG